MRALQTLAGLAAGAVAAAVVLVGAPPGASAVTAAPQYRADQIAQIEAADVRLEAGLAHTVTHPGAAFIKARFDGVVLGADDAITVASPDGGESYRYGPADVDDGGLRALSIEGETAEVLLHDDPGDGVAASARLASYSRGLNDAELASRAGGPESVCGRDDSLNAVCYRETDPVAWGASRSVARIIVGDDSYCTAWIAGDANRLMTNNHCLDTDAEARATEVQFGYECIVCAGGPVRMPIKVSGETVLATNRTLDFTLFTVADHARIAHLPHLELDPRRVAEGEKVFLAGHPGGRPLRITAASDAEPNGTGRHCQILDSAADGRGWNTDLAYLCDSQGGSSGSPVLSRTTGTVVGLHHFGGCPNSAVRMDLIHPLIAPYLEYDF
ncbi:serine protease [Glycomyces sp. TRM65418]|uniref:trypsin-like serine peptidase n=1 Tax=Glycomyces sp. TRM65418 TaxID=2867006 RepID=UPI001CE534F9|nr:serine protease [Glycomyces sp. TRM65418]MCC3765110.1 serine protease [Glycomyces sp. TRM65418]QZD54739.1 serine protease [Glycomyces sp. TRM65418]